MKREIIAGITITACVTLCAAVWPRSAEVGDLPAEPSMPAVNAKFEARSEEISENLLSDDNFAPEIVVVAEHKPPKTEISAEEKTEPASQTEATSRAVSKSASASSEPKSGDRTIIDGRPHIWILGFGWIEDEGGGSVCTTVGNPGDVLTGNKVGIMGGGITVDGKGDINKQVGIMGGEDSPANNNPVPGTKKYIDGILHMWVLGFGYVPYSVTNVDTVAEDMYENGHKIGIMGGAEFAPSDSPSPPTELPEPSGDVIYVPLQPPVRKDSTPPPYKPNGEPINP